MKLSEVETIITETEHKLNMLKEMITDYNNCKNETSKNYLLAAISKYADPLRTQTAVKTSA